MADVVRMEAPAKVNLRLRVLAREASGFHALESLFCAVSLRDALQVRRGAPGIRLRVQGGVETGPAPRNLAVRAADAFYRALGTGPAVEVELTKRIPSQAGLGGGSSDAAATLLALNALEGGPLDRAALLQLGIALGSDVPFFLCGSPLALGWGRGERLLALPPLPPRPVLVVHPGEAVPTGEAFRALAEARGQCDTPEAWAVPLPSLTEWVGIASVQGNDFQDGVSARIPRVAELLGVLRRADAEVALLAGSGGCVFGVFATPDERDAAAAVADLNCATWPCETLSAMPAPRVDPPADAG